MTFPTPFGFWLYSVYRYLKNQKLTPRLVWDKARETLVQNFAGYIILDGRGYDIQK
ncbi:MAG: hypothetical protein M3R11_07245 [Acidobacteriota bacterium]|nr:hypothetical protein [Acidobacteriota bacterium]